MENKNGVALKIRVGQKFLVGENYDSTLVRNSVCVCVRALYKIHSMVSRKKTMAVHVLNGKWF